MRQISIKKIVLCSLAAVSALLLLVGLFFPVIWLDYLRSNSNYDHIISGYDFLLFRFPRDTQTNRWFRDGIGKEFFPVLFGSLSVLTIVVSIVLFGLVVVFLLHFSENATRKVCFLSFMVEIGISTLNLLCAIVFVIIYNSQITSYHVDTWVWTTQAYFPVFINVLLFIVYRVSDKAIVDKQPIEEEKSPAQ